jgi:hypothetical protein
MTAAFFLVALAMPSQCPGGQCPIPTARPVLAPVYASPAPPMVFLPPSPGFKYALQPYARPLVVATPAPRRGLFGFRLRGMCR